MPLFRSDRPLDEIGREHLRRCMRLVADESSLTRAASTAAISLSVADIRRASLTKEEAATLQSAVLDAVIEGRSPGPAASYVFHASIVVAAVNARVGEPLLQTAAESAAIHLAELLLLALRSEQYDFILHDAGEALDGYGDLLGQAYFKVLTRGFRIMALIQMNRNRSTALEDLDVETRLEPHRQELRLLLPLARRESTGDKARCGMLDTIEGML